MANILKVDMQSTIKSLHERGWSQRRISRELGIHRRTVKRYLKIGAIPYNYHYII